MIKSITQDRTSLRAVFKFSLRLWVLGSYALLALVMTWPLAAQLGTAIPSDTGSDMLVHEWTLWWLTHSLLNLQNPFFTDLLVHPTGVALTSHNIAWVNFGVAFPLAMAFGQTTATSLTYLLIFTFNAYAMYLFAYDQTGSRLSGWVAGLIFGFFPSTLSDAGHINMLITGWLPLALLYLDRVIRLGGRRNAVMAGLFLALLGITRWQLLAIAAPLVMLFVLWRLSAAQTSSPAYVRQDKTTGAGAGSLRRTLGGLALSAGVMLLVMAPLLLPLVVAQLTRSSAGDLLVYEPTFSADLLGYFLPHSRLLVWRWLTQQLPANLQFAQQEIAFLGFTALLLAFVALIRRTRASILWLVMAVILIILALGPVVTVGGQKLDWLYTPYRLIEDTFWNKLIRKPWRYNVFLGLPLAMLAALGVTALRKSVQRRWGRGWAGALAVVIPLLLLAEYWLVPFPLVAADMTPAWYQQLAADREEFAILGLPISSRWADKYFMYYQMQHGKPIVGGHISRPPVESIKYMTGLPFLSDMLYMREMDPALVDVTHQLRYLADANVRYMIIHKRFVSAEKIDAWQDWLTFDPVYADDQTIVYRTAPQVGVDFSIEQALTPALGDIRTAYEPAALRQGDPLTVDLRWGASASPGVDYDYCVNLVDTAGGVAQQECAPISPGWPTSGWQANEVARSDHTFRVDPFLPAGAYQVTITLRDSVTGAAAGAALPLGRLQVDALPRDFTAPTPQHAQAAHFGPAILLYGYDLAAEGDVVKLVLYWGTERRLDRTYKVFVHAVDTATGAMLAQYDAAPRNWAYPTTWWEAGEVVADPVQLTLDRTQGAEVQLLVGLYDEGTGERLALDAAGAAVGEDGNALLITPEK